MTAPPIHMRRTPHGLAPASAYDVEVIDAYAIGAEVEITIRQRRSGQHHRWFFKALTELVKAGAVPYETVEEFLDALKLTCGITKVRQDIHGVPYILPGSISYAAKDQAAFRAFADRAALAIAAHYGITLEAAMEAAA